MLFASRRSSPASPTVPHPGSALRSHRGSGRTLATVRRPVYEQAVPEERRRRNASDAGTEDHGPARNDRSEDAGEQRERQQQEQ